MGEKFHQLGQLLFNSIPTILIFVVLHYYLKRVLYRPLREVLQRRSEKIEGKLARARATLEGAEEKLAGYEERLRSQRLEGYRRIEAQRQRALAEGHTQLSAARQQAAAALVGARQELAGESAQARQRLAATAEGLAAQILDQVLGKAVSA